MPGLQELTGRHALRTVKLKRKTKHETSKTDNNYSKSPPPLSTSLYFVVVTNNYTDC